MAALGSADPQLSDAATGIKIGQRVWKKGEAMYSIGDQAVKKSKMRESVSAQFDKEQVKGFIVGEGTNKKVRVEWFNLSVPEVLEHEC